MVPFKVAGAYAPEVIVGVVAVGVRGTAVLSGGGGSVVWAGLLLPYVVQGLAARGLALARLGPRHLFYLNDVYMHIVNKKHHATHVSP